MILVEIFVVREMRKNSLATKTVTASQFYALHVPPLARMAVRPSSWLSPMRFMRARLPVRPAQKKR